MKSENHRRSTVLNFAVSSRKTCPHNSYISCPVSVGGCVWKPLLSQPWINLSPPGVVSLKMLHLQRGSVGAITMAMASGDPVCTAHDLLEKCAAQHMPLRLYGPRQARQRSGCSVQHTQRLARTSNSKERRTRNAAARFSTNNVSEAGLGTAGYNLAAISSA